jgi:hypothetical protein
MGDIYNQHVKFGVDYFQENISAFPDILGFGNTLFSAKQYPLVISLGEVFSLTFMHLLTKKKKSMDTRKLTTMKQEEVRWKQDAGT